MSRTDSPIPFEPRRLVSTEAREAFARDGIVHVADFLQPGFAAALRDELGAHGEWNLVFRHEGRHFDLLPAQYADMPLSLRADLFRKVTDEARTGFQYWYFNVPLFDRLQAGLPLGPRQEQLCELLRTDAFIDAMRCLTGEAAIAYADFQATRYDAGCFLAPHDDAVEGKHRIAAYVIGLSPDWRPDWGGLLQFPQAETGGVVHALVPSFNSLTVFRVPRPHFVGVVAPFAAQGRYSVTGWLRERS